MSAALCRFYPTYQSAVEALESEHGHAINQWMYTDAEGEQVGAKVAFATPGQNHFDLPLRRTKNGWTVGAMPAPRPIYNLCQVVGADQVFIVPSERCADLMIEIGLLATTSFNGVAGVSEADWQTCSGKDAMITGGLGDTAYIEAVRGELSQLSPAPKVKIVGIPGLQDDEGVGDFIEARRAAGDSDGVIRELIVGMAKIAQVIEPAGIPMKRANILRLSEVRPEAIRWLWPGRIALGKLTIVAGDPGLGKSFVTLDLAARVSTGRSWPDAPDTQFTPGGVVLLNAEDDVADTIRPRLDAAGAEVSRIVAIQSVASPDPDTGEEVETHLNLATDLAAIENAIDRVQGRCRLVIIDPITAYCGGVDSHKNTDVRGLLAPLAALATRRKVAVLAVTHLNKSNAGPAIYRTMGSLAFAAAARAVWGVAKDKEEPRRRLFLPVKNNLAFDATGMAYEIRGEGLTPSVAWEPDSISVTADEAMSSERGDDERTDRDQAADWLRDALADGPMASRAVLAEAKTNGITEKTLRRAFADMGGTPYKTSFGGGWFWRLPVQDGQSTTEDSQDAHPQDVGTLGEGGHLGGGGSDISITYHTTGSAHD